MNIIGYHINKSVIATSEHEYCTESPWLEFLLRDSERADTIRIMAHLDYSVACLCKLIDLTDEECTRFFNAGKLYISPYTLRYVPGKFFSIKKGFDYNAQFINFSDANQYKAVDLTAKPTALAESAHLTGAEVYQALVDIGLHPTTLTSPVRAWEKEKMKDMNLPTYKDMPEGAVEYAEQCVDGVWVEAFQKGHFPAAHDYDIVGAHPYFTSLLLDTRHGRWLYSREEVVGAVYGYMRGTVHITAPFSPIAYRNNGSQWTTTGKWDRFLTSKQVMFIRKYGIGEFDTKDGWYWIPDKMMLPLRDEIIQLNEQRQGTDNTLKKSAIKRVMVGIWGKFLEQRQDGYKGDYYNPCWGVEVESQTRLKVAQFIMDNSLQSYLLSIAVDGVVSSSPVDCDNNGQLGSWKYNCQCPTIVVSSGQVAQQGKENDGDFVLRYDWLMDRIKEEPEAQEYKMQSMMPVSLGKAVTGECLDKLGEIIPSERTVRIGLETKRAYRRKPKCGRELLEQYKSSPWDVGSVQGKPSEREVIFHDP